MSKRIIKYYPFSEKEIERYYKETNPQEAKKTDKINESLINLRRKYLFLVERNEDLKRKTAHFSKIVKSKKIGEIVRIIRYFLNQQN